MSIANTNIQKKNCLTLLNRTFEAKLFDTSEIHDEMIGQT